MGTLALSPSEVRTGTITSPPSNSNSHSPDYWSQRSAVQWESPALSQHLQQFNPQPLFAVDITLIATQLQQTLQRSITDMLATLQQGHTLTNPWEQALVPSRREEHNPRSVHGQPSRQRFGAREPSQHDQQRSRQREDEWHPPKGIFARCGEETHVSKSPTGDVRCKPEDTRHLLNQKHLSKGYDASHILNKKVA